VKAVVVQQRPNIGGIAIKDQKGVVRPQNVPVAININLGADGSFRQDNVLNLQDAFNPEQMRHKLYAVRLEAGTAYQIDMTSNQIDSYLVLVDDKNLLVAQDDDGGGDLNARLIFTPVRTGLYHIEAASLDMSVGNYTLTIRRRP
jgi:hypothetical protein